MREHVKTLNQWNPLPARIFTPEHVWYEEGDLRLADSEECRQVVASIVTRTRVWR